MHDPFITRIRVFSSKLKKDIFLFSIFISPNASPLNIGLPCTKQVTSDLTGSVCGSFGFSGLLELIMVRAVIAMAATANQNIVLLSRSFIGTHFHPVFAVN